MSPYVRKREPVFPSPAGWLLSGGLVLGLLLILWVSYVLPGRGPLAGLP